MANANKLTPQQQADLWLELKTVWLRRVCDTTHDGTGRTAPDISHNATDFQTFITAHNV
jgi:hypothetical protein